MGRADPVVKGGKSHEGATRMDALVVDGASRAARSALELRHQAHESLLMPPICPRALAFTPLPLPLHSRRLQSLDLGMCGRCLTDTVAIQTGAFGPFPALAELRLAGAYRLGDAGLAALLRAAPNLRLLAVTQAPRITMDWDPEAAVAEAEQAASGAPGAVSSSAPLGGAFAHSAADPAPAQAPAMGSSAGWHAEDGAARPKAVGRGEFGLEDVQLSRGCGRGAGAGGSGSASPASASPGSSRSASPDREVSACAFAETPNAFWRRSGPDWAVGLESLDVSDSRGVSPRGLDRVLALAGPSMLALSLDGQRDLATDQALGRVARVLPRLARLSVALCDHVGDAGLKELAEALGPRLLGLCLDDCPLVTDVGIVQLARHCPRLSELSLRRCGRVSAEGVKALAANGELRRLSVNGLPGVSSDAVAALQACPLETLDLSWCRAVDDDAVHALAKECPRLKRLDLWGCSQLSEMALRLRCVGKIRLLGRGEVVKLNEVQ